MSMSAILIAALVMSVLGLLFGALLGVTGRVFKVPVNEKAEALRECLPGANCGACGFPGCDGYAAAGWPMARPRSAPALWAVLRVRQKWAKSWAFRSVLPSVWWHPWPARAMAITASRRLTIRA